MEGKHHNEIIEMAHKLTSGNYEGLDKYGLTEEMMSVELGEYSLSFHTAVFAYLAFDENRQLIDAAIRRDIDAP